MAGNGVAEGVVKVTEGVEDAFVAFCKVTAGLFALNGGTGLLLSVCCASGFRIRVARRA